MFADWTDRIAAGEVPPAPPRPQGIERNVVITEWDWADPKAYLHDEVATDRRNPDGQRERADLRLAGAERRLPAGARSRCATRASQVPLTVRDPNTPPTPRRHACSPRRTGATSRSGRARPTCTTRCSTSKGGCGSPRRSGRRTIPAFCKEGSNHPSAKLFPLQRAGRQLAVYDPKTKKLTHISTCFSTHHLMFAEDANNTLWTSGGGQVVGWLNTKMFDETQRRGEVAGLDGADPGHQRQRQARRLRRAEPAGRSRPRTSGSAARSTPWRRRRTDRCGDRCWVSRARSCG